MVSLLGLEEGEGQEKCGTHSALQLFYMDESQLNLTYL